MPPKRNRRNSKSPAADAMAECVLPLDMMLCILTRLPVKSIHRFKCVCKPLRDVFSSSKFAKMHRDQSSQNLENLSVVICDRIDEYELFISLLKLGSDEEMNPTMLNIPYPHVSLRAEFVGCCNGLLCMVYPRNSQLIALWNPALNNMFKFLPLPPDLELDPMYFQYLSVGFGYNEEEDDFKVIIIVDLEKYGKISLKVYSANSNSWSTIHVDFHFTVLGDTNDAIVNGSPYWSAFVGKKQILVCFDVRKMVLNIVYLPDFLTYEETKDILFVDWKGDLGAIVRKERNGPTFDWVYDDDGAIVCKKKNNEIVDVWVFNDVGKIGWTKNRSLGPLPVELKSHNSLQCLKNGKILVGEGSEYGELLVLDIENGGVKEAWRCDGFRVYVYTESMAHIKGMENLHETL